MRLDEVGLNWATDLARKYRNELGAVHLGRIHGTDRQPHGWVRCLDVESEHSAMIVARTRSSIDERLSYIVAAAVPSDRTRYRFGLSLVEHFRLASLASFRTIMQATCRCDLPANAFWLAAGFTPCFARFNQTARNIPTIIWRRHIGHDGAYSLLERRTGPKERMSGGRYVSTRVDPQMLFWQNPLKGTPEVVTSELDEVQKLLDRTTMTAEEKHAAISRRNYAEVTQK